MALAERDWFVTERFFFFFVFSFTGFGWALCLFPMYERERESWERHLCESQFASVHGSSIVSVVLLWRDYLIDSIVVIPEGSSLR